MYVYSVTSKQSLPQNDEIRLNSKTAVLNSDKCDDSLNDKRNVIEHYYYFDICIHITFNAQRSLTAHVIRPVPKSQILYNGWELRKTF